MISEKLEELLRGKVIQERKTKKGSFIICHPHFGHYWEMLGETRSRIEQYPGESDKEKVYRFLTDDYSSHICKLGGCSNETKYKTFKKGFDDYCSLKCVQKAALISGNFTTVGYKHSGAVKEKMSDAHPRLSGDKNPFRSSLIKSPEKRKLYSDRKRNWWKDLPDFKLKEIKENCSKAQARINNHSVYKYHKCGYFNSEKMGRQLYYRSSWELKVCVSLEHNPDVIYFTLEEMYLPYVDREGSCRYTRIDFLIKTSGGKTIIFEVKPLSLLTYKNNINKILGIQKYCVDKNYSFFLIHKGRLDSVPDIIKGEVENESSTNFIL